MSLKTIILNFKTGFDFQDYEFLTCEHLHNGNLQIYSAQTEKALLHDIASNINKNLSNSVNKQWQLIIIYQSSVEQNNPYLAAISTVLRFIDAHCLTHLTVRPKSIKVLFASTLYNPSVEKFEKEGNLFIHQGRDKVMEVVKSLNNAWQEISTTDRSSMKIGNDRFEDIDSSDFKEKINNAIQAIKSVVENSMPDEGLIKSNYKDEDQHLCSLSIEDTKSFINEFHQILDDAKNKPSKYGDFKPGGVYLELLKKHFSIFSERFNKFDLFYVKDSNRILNDSEQKNDFEFLLLVIILIRSEQFLKIKKPSEISIELKIDGLGKVLSHYIHSMEGMIGVFNSECNKTEILEMKQFSLSSVFSPRAPAFQDFSGISFNISDFLYSPSNYPKWTTYMEKIRNIIQKNKGILNVAVEKAYEEMTTFEFGIVTVTEPDIFRKRTESTDKIQQLESALSFPDFRDLVDDWNCFAEKKNEQMRMVLSKIPRLKTALFVCFSGFIGFVISLLFISNLTWTLWVVIFIALIILICSISVERIKSKARKIHREVKERSHIIRGDYQEYWREYQGYLTMISDMKLCRKNHTIIMEEAEKKNKYNHCLKYHISLMKRNVEKAEHLLDTYGLYLADSQIGNQSIEKGPDPEKSFYNNTFYFFFQQYVQSIGGISVGREIHTSGLTDIINTIQLKEIM